MEISEALASAAARLASEISADAILMFADNEENLKLLLRNSFAPSLVKRALGYSRKKFKLVAATVDDEIYEKLISHPQAKVLKLTVRTPSRISQIEHAVYLGLREGIFSPGELLVCVMNGGLSDGADSLFIKKVAGSESAAAEIIESDRIVAATIKVAMELGRNGYLGQPIGTAFVVGDSQAVLRHSHQLLPNPFRGHPRMMITDCKNLELIRRYALLDGAFVIGEDGRILAAGRFLDATAKADIPRGLGTRNRAVASITAATKAVGITVSGEDRAVRIYKEGRLLSKIDPRSKTLAEIYSYHQENP